jgi:hypothetical protein
MLVSRRKQLSSTDRLSKTTFSSYMDLADKLVHPCCMQVPCFLRSASIVAVQVGHTGLDRHFCDSPGLARLRACIY